MCAARYFYSSKIVDLLVGVVGVLVIVNVILISGDAIVIIGG